MKVRSFKAGVIFALKLLLLAGCVAAGECWGKNCPVQRGDIKMGNDPAADQIPLEEPQPSTIALLSQFTRPKPISRAKRFGPAEVTYWTIDGVMTDFALEADSDYHLVVRDDQGRTLIAEIPDPVCVPAESPFRDGIENARREFDALFVATRKFQSVAVPVEISGIGMFDPSHGQKGAASNDLELHPVLNISFRDEDQSLRSKSLVNTKTTSTPILPTSRFVRSGIAVTLLLAVAAPCLLLIAQIAQRLGGSREDPSRSLFGQYLYLAGLSTYLAAYMAMAGIMIRVLVADWETIVTKGGWWIVIASFPFLIQFFLIPWWLAQWNKLTSPIPDKQAGGTYLAASQ